jgi:transposase InsO family protein
VDTFVLTEKKLTVNQFLDRSAQWKFQLLIVKHRFRNQREASIAVFNVIEGWYNPRRRHSALGYLSPNNFGRRMSQAA